MSGHGKVENPPAVVCQHQKHIQDGSGANRTVSPLPLWRKNVKGPSVKPFNENRLVTFCSEMAICTRASSAVYDYSTGKPTFTTDLDGVTTTYSYDDPLDRLTEIHRAAGGGPNVDSHTDHVYQSPTLTTQYTSLISTFEAAGCRESHDPEQSRCREGQ